MTCEGRTPLVCRELSKLACTRRGVRTEAAPRTPMRIGTNREPLVTYAHAYAQARYKELTGWECPARGGPKSKELTPEQKKTNREAQLVISREMSHNREQITAVYLGW